MAKDAKGHGSEKHGEDSDSRAAAALANDHPKSEPVPAHDHFAAQAKVAGWTLDSRINKWRHPNSSALYNDSPRWARYAMEDHDSTGHPLKPKSKGKV